MVKRSVAPPRLTFEEYLAEGEIHRRYDIIDGVGVFMPNPTRRHQRILGSLYRCLWNYEVTSGRGQVILAP